MTALLVFMIIVPLQRRSITSEHSQPLSPSYRPQGPLTCLFIICPLQGTWRRRAIVLRGRLNLRGKIRPLTEGLSGLSLTLPHFVVDAAQNMVAIWNRIWVSRCPREACFSAILSVTQVIVNRWEGEVMTCSICPEGAFGIAHGESPLDKMGNVPVQ